MLAARFFNLAHHGACFLHHLFHLILLLLLVECWLAQDYLESTAPLNLGVAVWYLMIHVYDCHVSKKKVAAGLTQMHQHGCPHHLICIKPITSTIT